MATNTTTQTYITQEPAWMEALRQGLIADTKGLTQQELPVSEYQVAGMSPEQINSIIMARQGIGAYQPYLQQAGGMYGEAGEALGRAENMYGAGLGALGGAQDYYGQAGGYYGMGAGLGMAGAQAYDPNYVRQFMNPYQEEVTRKSVDEMSRQAGIQNQGLKAQAVKAGAFGGSRFGVQEAELGRNLADVQSKRIAEDYAQNYSQAQNAALNAFQNQQARTQAAGQMALGSGQGMAGIGQGYGQLGSMYGQYGQGIGQLGSLYGGLGTNYANLGQQAQALGQGDVSFQYNLGTNLQALNQKMLDAQRLNQQLYNMEPYQRLSYYADILNKTPSGQMATTQTTAPTPSPFSQFAGLGIAGLGAYNLVK